MLKFARPFSTVSVLFKEAATKATKTPKKPKRVQIPTSFAKKPVKKEPYKMTERDRNKHGRLNQTEELRLFDEGDKTTLNMDRVRLLRRHVHYCSNRDRQPAYILWMKDEITARGETISNLAKEYKNKTDAEKAAIVKEYSAQIDTSENVYDKFDYTSIRYPKLSGLNLFLAESLRGEQNIVEENKLVSAVSNWKKLSKPEKDEWQKKAKDTNAANVKRIQQIYTTCKDLYLKEKEAAELEKQIKEESH